MNGWRHVALAAGAALVVAACGGAAKSGSPPPETPAAAPPSDQAPAAQKAESPGMAPSTAPSGAAGGGVGDRRAAFGQARGELESAQRELDVAAGDCRAACRALASMDRAAGHLCGLVETDDDRGRCEEAKAKVRAARDKVRATCGECAGGPTTNRNAPIPSVP